MEMLSMPSIFVPLISGVLGAILSLVAFYAIPSIIPTDNIFHALLGGLFVGLSTNGSEQLVKQIKVVADQKKQEKKIKNSEQPLMSTTPTQDEQANIVDNSTTSTDSSKETPETNTK